jgi:hypothetical protein
MKLRKWLILTMAAALTVFACAKPQDRLVGTWKTLSGGTEVFFFFERDNSLNINNEVFTRYFVTEDNRLILGREEPAPFSIRGNTLTISQEDHALILKKVKYIPKKKGGP